MESRLVIGIGTGWPIGSKLECNAISSKIAETAFDLSRQFQAQLIFVGGNGTEEGGFPEALRMRKFLDSSRLQEETILTDCEREDMKPSTNTPENAANIARFLEEFSARTCDVVGLQDHVPRIRRTVRKALLRNGLLDLVEMNYHSIDAPYAFNNAQWQLRSRTKFLLWTALANVHHCVMDLA